ncbi:MAG: SMC-Scp complex subunit ScpB [Pseudomonadota bacterium]|nr:SMC-Scp complex subunit ScpB [Pseudomonadota bacterium]
MSDDRTLIHVLEAALMAAAEPLSEDRLLGLFEGEDQPDKRMIRQALEDLTGRYADSALELVRVASGFRFQIRNDYAPWVARLEAERPARYSRALLETLALIAYRQPVTRGEIEHVRGVSVSTHIIRTLLDRGWVRVVGHREVPGRPALYGTTPAFLDYFNLRSLTELPALAEFRDPDSLNVTLALASDPESSQAEVSAEHDTHE